MNKFGDTRNEALIGYEDFILKGIGVEATLDFNSGHSDGIFGDEEFVEVFWRLLKDIKNEKLNYRNLLQKYLTVSTFPKQFYAHLEKID